MKITILTLFPDMFVGPFNLSIIKKAKEKKLIEITVVDIRDFGVGKHKEVDNTIYGGGTGMIMRVDVLERAIISQRLPTLTKNQEKVFLLSASGKKFAQSDIKKFTRLKHIILVCGHYEGVDSRISSFIDEEISVGDFVVTGGELPAMLVTDAIVRTIPGVLKDSVTENESFSQKFKNRKGIFLEYPQFTKPREYKNIKVPKVLLSGDHKKISEWRQKHAVNKTRSLRPDLIKE